MVANKIRPPPAAPSNKPSRPGWEARRVRTILYLAVKAFWGIERAQWAGAFAFNAFFSLFPLMVSLVKIASIFVDRDNQPVGHEHGAQVQRAGFVQEETGGQVNCRRARTAAASTLQGVPAKGG